MSDAAIEAVLRRDRVIVAAAVVVLTALAWAYVWWLAADMDVGGMDMSDFRMIPAGMGLMMPATAPWTTTEFAFVFGMWAVMMIGMMTPSVAPMLLIYARVGREAAHQGKPLAASAYFAAGYLLTWIGFALVATSAQWALERAALLTPMMAGASDILGGLHGLLPRERGGPRGGRIIQDKIVICCQHAPHGKPKHEPASQPR